MPEEGRPRTWVRAGALGALALAVAVVAIVLLAGGGGYEVKARFISASQLVKGDRVEVAGQPVGKVSKIALADDGQAELTLSIDGDYAPLHQGTFAVVRLTSLSGVANRYVDLMMGPGTAPDIPDGDTLPAHETQSTVDLDQVFSIFDPVARTALSGDIKGFAQMAAGNEDEANAALRYLDPALASSSRLFAELNRDTPSFARFVTQTSKLVTTLAERRTQLTQLVDHLATTSTALASRHTELANAIGALPPFMRRANTTFANLRTTLSDLDPLVAASKPVVHKLRPLLGRLRPFAREAVPTIRDLSKTIRRPGADNDLVELTRLQPALEHVANGPVQANGKQREGAFPASTKALGAGTPELAFARPYAVDLTSWFDDFSESGEYDALGSFSRAGLALSAFTVTPSATILPVPPALQQELLAAGASLFRNNRCPGSSERDPGDGSTTFRPSPGYDCDPNIKPVGP